VIIQRRIFLQQAMCASAGAALARTAFGRSRIEAGHEIHTMTIIELAHLLDERRITSRRLVEQALAAIKDPGGEGKRAFILVHETAALAAADRIDARRRAGAQLPPLAGIPVSIKDNFDEAGIVTLAGSTALAGTPPAARDSVVVGRLKDAGAVLVGRTNMTEFAYSGLGINPHYGTPRNAFDRAASRLPGGSTSGGAVSVTDGMAACAVGTDTGGSVRIPAALNGLVGFKPTAQRVPLDGVLPLSVTLDSAGPIARSVADCALLDRILAGEAETVSAVEGLRGLKFAVPKTGVLDDLSDAVAAAFSKALERLSAAGAQVVELPMVEFARAADVNPRGVISSVEAFRWHRQLINDAADKYDPRVIVRIRPGAAVSEANYLGLLAERQRFVQQIEAASHGYDALLMPTTPETAPTIAAVLASDESYFRFNGRMLRNPAIVNLFDGCALSIPCHEPGSAPVGLMIAGLRNTDRRILAIGQAIEKVLQFRLRAES
jgi:aspartyl-tRNA(Asn)/glutamyl-tRNA(Gln) amidotransferase subunit A